MQNYSELTDKLAVQVRDAVTQAEQMTTDLLATIGESVTEMTAKLPAVEIPGLAALPQPKELVASAFELVEWVFSAQKTFVSNLFDKVPASA